MYNKTTPSRNRWENQYSFNTYMILFNILLFLMAAAGVIVGSLGLSKAYDISVPKLSNSFSTEGITFENAYITNVTTDYTNVTNVELNVSFEYRFTTFLKQGAIGVAQSDPLVITFQRVGKAITANVGSWSGTNCTTGSLTSIQTVPPSFLVTDGDESGVYRSTRFLMKYNVDGTDNFIGMFRLYTDGTIKIDPDVFGVNNFNGSVTWEGFSIGYSQISFLP